MNYVFYGITDAVNKTFSDDIMLQDDFIAKYGVPNVNGLVKINDEIYTVYLMNHTLQQTMIFATGFRAAFVSRGFIEV
jgi:hypothetical protein